MKKYLSSLLMLLSLAVFSQELSVKEKLINPSKKINDGVIELNVEGGTPPYTYKWSNQETALTSNKAMNLVEGLNYDVTITDATGTAISKEYKVPAEVIEAKDQF